MLSFSSFSTLSLRIRWGSLLYRLKWTEGCTYTSIADMYASFTVERYGEATVVFDGYDRANTKDNTHKRRNTSVGRISVNITEATKFAGKKEDFLSNENNKKVLTGMITVKLRQRKLHCHTSKGRCRCGHCKSCSCYVI